jgi:hypothetical protein
VAQIKNPISAATKSVRSTGVEVPSESPTSGEPVHGNCEIQKVQQMDVTSRVLSIYNSEPQKLKEEFAVDLFGILNPGDLRTDPDAEPQLGISNEGSCWLVVSGAEEYIVPKPGLIYQSAYHSVGGMRKMFDCQGYEPGYRYKHLRLIRPGRVKHYQNSWRLVERGMIAVFDPEKISA